MHGSATGTSTTTAGEGDVGEEDQTVDEFLSSLGFEFVDVYPDGKGRSIDDGAEDILSEGTCN